VYKDAFNFPNTMTRAKTTRTIQTLFTALIGMTSGELAMLKTVDALLLGVVL
jgi:hypothetical protein